MPKIHDSKHISTFPTIGSPSTGNHRLFTLMSLNLLAPAFVPHYQSSSDPPFTLCKSTPMSLHLAEVFCGMPLQIIPSINQHITHGTLLLPLLQPTNQSKLDAAPHQPTLGSSALLFSPLKHQAYCLQAIHKTIQRFNQHLKAEHIERQTLQLIVLQLQKDFALLRYLLFSPVESISNKDTAATSPLFIPNPNPTSSAFSLPDPGETKLRRFTPVGAVGPPKAKTNNSANADFQPTPNTQEAPPITAQNFTSTISKLEKLFADEIATYTSITA